MKLLDFFRSRFQQRRKPNIETNLKEKEGNKQTMKKFDIVVFSEDEGRRSQRPENGVYAMNAQQLASIYEATGEKIQIIREYEDEDRQSQKIETKAEHIAKPEVSSKNEGSVENPPIAHKIPKTTGELRKSTSAPKYFSICGTECKLENDKIYQKQWVKILGNEASQYRLISDTNNKEIPLNGKHLEMLKWILVQNDSDNSENNLNTSIMQILNG